MTVLITGASGLVGQALTAFLASGGHKVRRLVRGTPQDEGEYAWDPAAEKLDPQALDGADAVVHLAGENIAAGRWSEARKARIRRSRFAGTEQLVEAMRRAEHKPQVFVSASAIGFYGDRGDEWLEETSTPGVGFLAELCQGWEQRARAIEGVRSVQLRFGLILSSSGGALEKMLLPFKMGAGGRVGSGRQWMSWIALDDAVGAIHHALTCDSIEGPANVVTPSPVTNAEFTRTLGRVLKRPTVFPLPAFGARLAFGELAEELLLAGQRVRPEKLQRSGFEFSWPELEGALRHVLGR